MQAVVHQQQMELHAAQAQYAHYAAMGVSLPLFLSLPRSNTETTIFCLVGLRAPAAVQRSAPRPRSTTATAAAR